MATAPSDDRYRNSVFFDAIVAVSQKVPIRPCRLLPALVVVVIVSTLAARLVSRELLESVLESEEEHVDWLETQLELRLQSEGELTEARQAVADGAQELDMVLNIGALKTGDLKTVEQDIQAVRREANNPVVLKVIIETCLLTHDEKVKACKIAQNAGADFVKTSTGFASGGAAVEDVRLMKQTVGDNLQVKASGGIKDWRTAAGMLRAGATRIGASAGIAILAGAPK